MKIAVLKERKEAEARVAITPDMVKKYAQLGLEVAVEVGAGYQSYIADDAYRAAGAMIAATPHAALQGAQIVLCVRPPGPDMLQRMPDRSLLVGMLEPGRLDELLPHYSQRALTTFTLELLPRISRAQSMDVLSSQSNLAGYRAIIDAVHALTKAVPMMMTAAGTIVPARVLVLGAGVAGLQAIATAKRLGAIVSAFDVRPAVKEQVESLGAAFIEVPAEEGGETKGGYAREMSEDYQRRQRQRIHEAVVTQDIVVTTALIPGKPAPVLVTEEMVRGMKPGSVIVDLAAAQGGNCPLTEPDHIIVRHGVTLIGYTDLPSRLSRDASQLYARNLYHFVTALLVDKQGELAVQWDDEIVKGTLLTRDGQVVHPGFAG